MVEMIMVDSTSIEAIGYDLDDQELHVRFLQSGITYVYREVPDWVFQELKIADSMGSYFNRNIRQHYEFEKLD